MGNNGNGTIGSMDRRAAMGAIGIAGLGIAAMSPTASAKDEPAHFSPENAGWDSGKGEYVLPKLAYDYNALEPHLDAQTMEIHHSRHHAGYVKGANTAIAEIAKLRASDSPSGSAMKAQLRELAFNLGGHINHTLWWQMMKPAKDGGGGKPSGLLADTITRDFGGYSQFASQFRAAASSVEGGGWAWLVHDSMSRRLMVVQMEKQQDLFLPSFTPLLGIDVWEHAYYIKFQNKRADYIDAFMNVVNWDFASKMLARVEH